MDKIEQRALGHYPKLYIPISGEGLVDTGRDNREVYIFAARETRNIDLERGKEFIKELLLSVIGIKPQDEWIEGIQNEYEEFLNKE